jgi:mannose-6-phosphate isomerase-like protein (cupin superfamily)
MSEPYLLQSGEGKPITVSAANMVIKTVEDANNRLFVAEHVMPPTFVGPPPHIHDEMDHAFYILEGTLRFVMAGDELIASAGSFAYVPRGIPHSFGNPFESQTRFLEINTPAGFESYYTELGLAFPPGAALDPQRIYQIQRRYDTRPAPNAGG